MEVTFYNDFKRALLAGQVDLDGGATVKCALLDSTYTPDIDAHDFFDDVDAAEVSGTGYTAGGATLGGLAVTQDSPNDQGVWDANDVTWSTSTITARYAVLYISTGTASTSRLIGYIDFGANKSTSAEDFTISWDPTGIAALAQA